MRDVFAHTLADLARTDDRITFVTGDLGFGVFEKFAEQYPDQYLNVGVAEQNMIAVSTGLALEGRIVFAYSIGNFPVLRCLEQIRNDAAYHGANVKVVSIGGGFSYGPLGMSHHATEDLAVMRATPEVTTVSPGTKFEVAQCVKALVDTPGTCYLRLDKSNGSESAEPVDFTFGVWRAMREGADVTLVATGGVLGEAQLAAEQLSIGGIEARVVSAHVLAPISDETVLQSVGSPSLVVTVEEHVTRGGLGGLVAEVVAGSAVQSRVHRLGISGSFMSTVGSQSYLRSQVGLDAASIASTVQQLLAGKCDR